MTLIVSRAGAVSHVGRVRSNNQDSGFIGEHLYLVADGMGGHAGGDVASAIAAKHFAEHDAPFDSVEDAEQRLKEIIVEANTALVETVAEHSELRGMGTTASLITLVGGEKLVIGHIGDSRIYRLHNGQMTQETKDHTFVQKLVDAGRITPAEAEVHPRRSVLMKVLGDVETKPDADTYVYDAIEGDRWLLCSDGLSSYVNEDDIHTALAHGGESSREICDDLVQLALDNGAPDNVTVVVLEIGTHPLEPLATKLVGSAANEVHFGRRQPSRRRGRSMSSMLDPLRKVVPTRPENEEYVPPSDAFLEQLIREEKRRKKVRILSWFAAILMICIAVFGAGVLAYSWTQQQYFVGESNGHVAIYQGVQQSVGPVELHHLVEETDIPVEDLSVYQQQQVEQTINTGTLEDAHQLVNRLREAH